MKKILKTIACCLGALAIAFTAFFVPTTKKSANANTLSTTITEGRTWTSDNIIQSFPSMYYEGSDINSPRDEHWSQITTSFRLIITNVSLNSYTLSLFASDWFEWNGSTNNNVNVANINYAISSTGSFYTCGLTDQNGNWNKFTFSVIPSGGYPSFVMKSLEVGNYTSFKQNVDTDYFGFPSVDYYNNHFILYSYTDTSGWRYIFGFRYSSVQTDVSSLKYSIFYDFASVDLSDNDIYNEGFNRGYDEGLTTGTNEGYANGYNSGYNVGFGNGRNEGIQNANNYSFLGLFGAIVDAPLTGLRSLFNFEFLGINLLSFITSLLTIALITFVIKKLMGR